MFAKLTGIIDTLMNDSLILDVGGVGYHVFASGRTLGTIGQVGNPASLLIETHVREDHIHLYGFSNIHERDWFRLLLGVQGVGARSALAIMTVCPAERLALVIASNDVNALRQADGVGPKLASRIASELKDKVQHMNLGAAAQIQPTTIVANEKKKASKKTNKIENNELQIEMSIDQDVVSALINLGYGRSEAFSAVVTIRQKNDNTHMTFDELFKAALKELTI